jgi:pimeloyl-ACP methyl ester carboxylesterase
VPFAELDEVRLFYTDEGSGEPSLLFVHGYACDSHDWSWQLPHFGASHRVIAVDLRGHGRSTAPAEGYSALSLATDLAKLLELLNVRTVVACGHSLGALVVSALAVEYPRRLAALVCVDPGYLFPDEVGAHGEELAAKLRHTDPVPTVQQILDVLASPNQPPAFHTWYRRRAAGVPAHVLRQTMDEQVTGLALMRLGRSYLSRRTCPILSIYADPARAAIERDLFVDDRSRAIGWEEAGHWLHQERAEEFNGLVDEWLKSLSHSSEDFRG